MELMISVVSLALSAAAVNGQQFPRVCVEGVSEWPVRCCPYFKASVCGNELGRGHCLPVPFYKSLTAPDMKIDERDNFPIFFFNWTCQCTSHFMGYNCGECAPAWRGDDCDIPRIIIRKDIRKATPAQRTAFIAALHYAKTRTDPVYVILKSADRLRSKSFQFVNASYLDVMIYAHYHAIKPFINNTQENSFINFAHGSTNFLCWHRYFLFLVERQLQRCMQDENLALYYHKWEDDAECTICNDDFLGASEADGKISLFSVFSEWRTICSSVDYPQSLCVMENCPCERPRIFRMPGLRGRIPQAWEVNRCLTMPDVDTAPYTGYLPNSFRYCYEGYHNMYHRFLSGMMSSVLLSTNDPIFFFHHCNVDRVIDLYYHSYNITPESYPPNYMYGHEPRRCITPFLECVKNKDMMTESKNLGIIYE